MSTVKTAISIQESLFEQVNDLAEELEMPRSQLFVLAVKEFIERYESGRMLSDLNEIYGDDLGQNGEALREGMRRRHRALVEGEW